MSLVLAFIAIAFLLLMAQPCTGCTDCHSCGGLRRDCGACHGTGKVDLHDHY